MDQQPQTHPTAALSGVADGGTYRTSLVDILATLAKDQAEVHCATPGCHWQWLAGASWFATAAVCQQTPDLSGCAAVVS